MRTNHGFLMLMAWMTSALPLFAAPLTLRVASVNATAGGEVEVPVDVAGGIGLGAMQGELVFDPQVLEPVTADAGAALQGTLMDANLKKPGRIPFSFATGGSVKGEGTLLKVRFHVVGSAGATSPLGMEKCRVWDDAPQEKELFVTIEGGKATVVRAFPVGWAAAGAIALVLLALILRLARRRPAAAQVCGKCAAPLREGAKFCDKCGAANS